MYRLALAHDSNIATALSSVTVAPRRAAASTNIVGREQELEALQPRVRARAARQGAHRRRLRRSGRGQDHARRRVRQQLEERGEPVRIGRGRCSERLAGTEAYLPVLEALDSLQRNEHLGSLDAP